MNQGVLIPLLMAKISYGAKLITLGVIGKAILMGTLVTVLAATTFTQSIILVLVSATATGIFGVIIVLVQTHSNRDIHLRIDSIEDKAKVVADTTEQIATDTKDIRKVVSNGTDHP